MNKEKGNRKLKLIAEKITQIFKPETFESLERSKMKLEEQKAHMTAEAIKHSDERNRKASRECFKQADGLQAKIDEISERQCRIVLKPQQPF